MTAESIKIIIMLSNNMMKVVYLNIYKNYTNRSDVWSEVCYYSTKYFLLFLHL